MTNNNVESVTISPILDYRVASQLNGRVVVVLPTYNEQANIRSILKKILQQQEFIDMEINVLVVDDSSPDGTAKTVQAMAKKQSAIHLITGRKYGLGNAYIRGFRYALHVLGADVIVQMDADFSHDPADLPRLINRAKRKDCFAIGSRYVKGGSVPQHWPLLRKLNSKGGNLVARFFTGLWKVQDLTSGFRAISGSLLQKVNLNKIQSKGYGFQVALLYQAAQNGARIVELPIAFSERKFGSSKLKIADVVGFIIQCLSFRLGYLPFIMRFILPAVISGGAISLVFFLLIGWMPLESLFTVIVFASSLVLTLQGSFALLWMLYAWDNPQAVAQNTSPRRFLKPQYSFTAIIPARHEENVIEATIRTVTAIDYPEKLKEVLIVCQSDDKETISKARNTIKQLSKSNVRLITFSGKPINKPHSLNIGLSKASKNVVAIFDAEDEPHSDIYNIVNTVMLDSHADVVQSGVQLMNFKDHWFSALNVLEYFFWFKSGLHFFNRIGGVTPLGGNTVFFKRAWLSLVGGWDENCLTEDADIGFRLSLTGANIQVVYDERHVTREETPHNTQSFMRQRTRWIQGFLQVFMKDDWKNLPRMRQKIFASYILFSIALQAFLLAYIPLAIWIAFTQKLPIVVSLFSFFPLYLFAMQMLILSVGLFEFTKAYQFKFSFVQQVSLLVFFVPYQALIVFSAFRAIWRLILKSNGWEKTAHHNAHREIVVPLPKPANTYVK